MGTSLPSAMNGCGGVGMKEHLGMEGIRAGATQPDGFIAEVPVVWQCSLGRWCHCKNTQSQLKVGSGLNYRLAMLTQER